MSSRDRDGEQRRSRHEWFRRRYEQLDYHFDELMSRGTRPLIVLLGVLTAALVVVVSGLVVVAGLGSNDLGNQLYQSLLHALFPGSLTADKGEPLYILPMVLLAIGGLLFTSVLIALIATGVRARLDHLARGRSLVVERDHTIILGWSEQIFPIIDQLVTANQHEKRPSIAILAERDKIEMEDAIRARVGETHGTRIICRTGSPIDADDIKLPSTTKCVKPELNPAKSNDFTPGQGDRAVVLATHR